MRNAELKIAIFGLLFIILTSPIFSNGDTITDSTNGKILYVGGSGEGNYTSIQAAINAAENGDIIFVYHGEYREHILVNKRLSILGESMHDVIVDGSTTGRVFSIVVDSVKICNLTIKNGGNHDGDAELYITSNNNIIENNHIFHSSNGDWSACIYLYGANRNTIRDNSIIRNFFGIRLKKSDYNKIYTNNISQQTSVGSGIEIGVSAYNEMYGNSLIWMYAGITVYGHDHIINSNGINGCTRG